MTPIWIPVIVAVIGVLARLAARSLRDANRRIDTIRAEFQTTKEA